MVTENPGGVAGSSRARTAADLCEQIELSKDAVKHLRPDLLPGELIDLLVKAELFGDALRLLAFWLPKQAAVAWGCRCFRSVSSASQLSPAQTTALEAAERWAEKPSDENRRAAEAAAEHTKYDGPTTWLALGAFWSGGSLTGPELPVVPPSPSLTAQAITGALIMVAVEGKPKEVPNRYRAFLADGRKAVPVD